MSRHTGLLGEGLTDICDRPNCGHSFGVHLLREKCTMCDCFSPLIKKQADLWVANLLKAATTWRRQLAISFYANRNRIIHFIAGCSGIAEHKKYSKCALCTLSEAVYANGTDLGCELIHFEKVVDIMKGQDAL